MENAPFVGGNPNTHKGNPLAGKARKEALLRNSALMKQWAKEAK
jgi:hypothetical protein